MRIPNFEDLTIRDDFMFKKVMQHPRICKHLIEELLQIKIAKLSYPDAERSIDNYSDSKGIRLDIIAADEHNTRYNLEMQVKNTLDPETGESLLFQRTRYYQSMLDMELLQKGQDYDELPATVIIFICVYDILHEGSYVYTLKRRCLEHLTMAIPDKTTTVFLNTKGSKGAVSQDIKSFCEYVNTRAVTSSFTQEIEATVVRTMYDKKERENYMVLEMRLRELEKEVRAEARAEAIAEGRAEGRAEGELAEKRATIARMAKAAVPASVIALATELPEAEVASIIEQGAMMKAR